MLIWNFYEIWEEQEPEPINFCFQSRSQLIFFSGAGAVKNLIGSGTLVPGQDYKATKNFGLLGKMFREFFSFYNPRCRSRKCWESQSWSCQKRAAPQHCVPVPVLYQTIILQFYPFDHYLQFFSRKCEKYIKKICLIFYSYTSIFS